MIVRVRKGHIPGTSERLLSPEEEVGHAILAILEDRAPSYPGCPPPPQITAQMIEYDGGPHATDVVILISPEEYNKVEAWHAEVKYGE